VLGTGRAVAHRRHDFAAMHISLLAITFNHITLNLTGRRARHTVSDAPIYLRSLAILKHFTQPSRRLGVFGDNQDPAGVFVQAVDKARRGSFICESGE